MASDFGEKYSLLREIIAGHKKVLVAFSGGADSAFLLKVCCDVLGRNAFAATADSPSLARGELLEAKEFASSLGARHFIINTTELQNDSYSKNDGSRCYHCKTELYSRLAPLAARLGSAMFNGTNADDSPLERPGMKAAAEFCVLSPLRDAGLSKREIRVLSKQLGLPTWDKPAMACLSSRIALGETVSVEKLQQVEDAEFYLQSLGFNEVRVRIRGGAASVEVPPERLEEIGKIIVSVRQRLLSLGFSDVSINGAGLKRVLADELVLLQ